MVNPSGKFRNLVFSHHSVHHQLRITGNRHQRGFQFVRNIGRKFSSHCLSLLQLLQLRRDLFILLVYPYKKGTQLLISYIFQRVLQIQLINGRDQLLCLSLNQEKFQGQNPQHKNPQQRKAGK